MLTGLHLLCLQLVSVPKGDEEPEFPGNVSPSFGSLWGQGFLSFMRCVMRQPRPHRGRLRGQDGWRGEGCPSPGLGMQEEQASH